MRVEQMQYLVTILEHGSFRRASEELHVSQAALSESIRNLERELGDRLLDRDRRGVRLTSVGEDIMPHINNMLESARALHDQVGDYRALRRGQVDFATVSAISNTILPHALRAFNNSYPGIQTRITETGSVNIMRQVSEGHYDLGVVARFEDEPEKRDELEFSDLLKCRIVLCAPRGHHLLDRERVSITDVADEPLILFRSGYLMHDLILKLFGRRNLNIIYFTDNSQSSKQMIAAGVGVTLLPELSIVNDLLSQSGDLTYVPMVGKYTHIRLSLVALRHRYRSRASELFGQALLKQAALHPMHAV